MACLLPGAGLCRWPALIRDDSCCLVLRPNSTAGLLRSIRNALASHPIRARKIHNLFYVLKGPPCPGVKIILCCFTLTYALTPSSLLNCAHLPRLRPPPAGLRRQSGTYRPLKGCCTIQSGGKNLSWMRFLSYYGCAPRATPRNRGTLASPPAHAGPGCALSKNRYQLTSEGVLFPYKRSGRLILQAPHSQTPPFRRFPSRPNFLRFFAKKSCYFAFHVNCEHLAGPSVFLPKQMRTLFCELFS